MLPKEVRRPQPDLGLVRSPETGEEQVSGQSRALLLEPANHFIREHGAQAVAEDHVGQIGCTADGSPHLLQHRREVVRLDVGRPFEVQGQDFRASRCQHRLPAAEEARIAARMGEAQQPSCRHALGRDDGHHARPHACGAVPIPLRPAGAAAGLASAGASAAGRAGRAMGSLAGVNLGEVLGQRGDAGVFVEQGRRQPQPRVVVQPFVQRDRQQRVQAQLDEPQVRLGDLSVQLLRQQLLQVADENSRPRARRTTSVQPGPQIAHQRCFRGSAVGRPGNGALAGVDLGEVLGQGGDAGVFVEQGRRQPQPCVVVQPFVQRDRQQRVQTQLDEPQVRLGDLSVQLLRQQLLQVADENPATFLDRTTSVQPGPQAARRRPGSLRCGNRPCGRGRDGSLRPATPAVSTPQRSPNPEGSGGTPASARPAPRLSAAAPRVRQGREMPVAGSFAGLFWIEVLASTSAAASSCITARAMARAWRMLQSTSSKLKRLPA